MSHRGAIGSSPMANGNAEGLMGFPRRNFMVPIPRLATWEEFNDHLEAQCRKRQDDVLRGQTETIGERLARDLAAMPAHTPEWPSLAPPHGRILRRR